jgi:hypothetical protein
MDGRSVDTYHLVERTESNIASVLSIQSSKCVFLKRSWAQTSYAKLNPVSGRPLSLSSQHSNKSNRFLASLQSSSCVTRANWPTRSKTSMHDSASTCQRSRRQYSTVGPRCKRTLRFWRTRTRIHISLLPHPADSMPLSATRSFDSETSRSSSLMSAIKCWIRSVSFRQCSKHCGATHTHHPRYAPRRPGDFPRHSDNETGHDVQRYAFSRD